MTHFDKLLLAIDLGPESDALIERVLKMCEGELSGLHVVHVIKSGMHDGAKDEVDAADFAHAQRLLDHTTIRVRELLHANGLEIPCDRLFLLSGEPAFEIKNLASKIAADLVIVGSHSKENDWLHLPGATTNCVIQGISSDVMAIKI